MSKRMSILTSVIGACLCSAAVTLDLVTGHPWVALLMSGGVVFNVWTTTWRAMRP